MTRHERGYVITLIVIAALLVFCTGEYIIMMLGLMSGNPAGKFTFELLVFVMGFFLVDIILILVLFLYWPMQSRIVLVALNIILLFWVPFGTVLGIYCVWKINNKSIPLQAEWGA